MTKLIFFWFLFFFSFKDAFNGCQILPCSHKIHKDCATEMLKNGMWVVYGLFSTFCRTLLYICTDFISYSSSLFYFWINFVLLVTTSYFNLCYHVYPFMYIYHVYLFMYIYHLYPFLAMYIYHVYPFMYIYHLYPFMYYLSCISLYEYLSCISHIPLLSHASL